MFTVSDLVKNNNVANLVCYRDGELWYEISIPGECLDCGAPEKGCFEFPVPISDTGTGIFYAQMKAITLMRWVRKHLERRSEWEKEKASSV